MNENKEVQKFYLYYPENDPVELPDWCEQQCAGFWCYEHVPPSGWTGMARRWPVPEWKYRAHHWMKAHTVECPEGYEVVGFGPAHCGHIFLSVNGSPCKGSSLQSVPILKQIETEIEWVTPTDEDVINCVKETGKRPVVQVRDVDSDEWEDFVLYGVDDNDAEFPFMVSRGNFRQCRMDAKLREEWK